jgi:hypothetical protein
MWKKLQRSHWELILFVAIALWAVSNALRPGHVVGDGVDMYGSLWFFWYAKEALESFSNPSVTDLFFYPLGKNIFTHTGNNLLDAYLSAPFQWLFGFPGWSRWWVGFVLVGNALSFRVLARHLFASKNVALAATVAWQMNPYVLFELTCGRYTQAFLIFLPLAVWAFLKMQEDERWRWPLIAGCLTGLQAWTYWFMGYFMAFAFLCLAVEAFYRSRRGGLSMAWRPLLSRMALSGLAALLVVLPGLWAMSHAASDQLVPGLASGSKALWSLPPDLANNVSQALHGYDLFGTRGPPMLTLWTWGPLLLLWIVVGPGRARWLPIFVFAVVFSLGPFPTLWGFEDPQVMPHYMAAYHYLPFFDRLWFPYRILVMAFFVGALAIGFLAERLAHLRPNWGRRIPILLVGFVACTGLEQSRFGIFPLVSRDLSPPIVFDWIASQEDEKSQAIIHLPFGPSQPNIVWQILHERPLWGGMGENANLLWPEGYRRRLKNSFFKSLLRAVNEDKEISLERPYVPVQRVMIEREGFRWVVLDRAILMQETRLKKGPSQVEALTAYVQNVVERISLTIGTTPVVAEDRFVVWDLLDRAVAPAELQPNLERLTAITWELVDVPVYEKALVESGRAERPLPRGTLKGEAGDGSGKKRIRKGSSKDGR